MHLRAANEFQIADDRELCRSVLEINGRYADQLMMEGKLILVTGATGYVGGRLVPRLLEAGYRVRCLIRDPARVEGRAWVKRVELVQGDVLDPQSLVAVM